MTQARVVLIYANWCNFCNKLMPVWDGIMSEHPEFKGLVVKADGDAKETQQKYGAVRGFPTIKYYDKTQKVYIASNDFDSQSIRENVNGFVEFLEEKTGTQKKKMREKKKEKKGRIFQTCSIM